MTELPLAAVIRLMKSAGVERVGADAAQKMTEKAEALIVESAKEALKYAEVAGRKTIKEIDITRSE